MNETFPVPLAAHAKRGYKDVDDRYHRYKKHDGIADRLWSLRRLALLAR